jgi:hypothetical protein
LSRRQLQQIARSAGGDRDATPAALRFEQWLSLFDHLKSVAGVQAQQAILGSEQRLRRQQAGIMKVHPDTNSGQAQPALRAHTWAVAAVKFDVAPAVMPRWAGQILVALFGDEAPMTAPPGPRVGRSIGRIDPSDWSLHHVVAGPLARPVDVRFDPAGRALYILDFGRFEMSERGVLAKAETGALWRLGP